MRNGRWYESMGLELPGLTFSSCESGEDSEVMPWDVPLPDTPGMPGVRGLIVNNEDRRKDEEDKNHDQSESSNCNTSDD